MLGEVRGSLKGWIFGAVALLSIPHSLGVNADQPKKQPSQKQSVQDAVWKEFHSIAGKCSMSFPDYPEHVSEQFRMEEGGYSLSYDAYISSADQKKVFMLLIAQYPDFVDESLAQMSLEQFLNGILNHHPSNQLLFADLRLVEGREALEFLIRSGSVYFKGRALMIKNSLYLMAMECEMQHFDEGSFALFADSFKLKN